MPILISKVKLTERTSYYFFCYCPKASAEGACIISKMGYCYGVWLVTEVVVCVDCNAIHGVSGIWVIHIGPKSGCKLVTLFGGNSYDGMSAGMWVILTGPKSGCKLVTLFGGYSYDGVSAGIWVIHSGPKSGCKLVTLFECYSYDNVNAGI